ncbi:hypothetical protein HDU85_004976 [Gaertneriomyces sp. JEL0708]|nr:hypothetical protein HDU85_004976 [Gaertneriomyces sp. JEL0708]
MLRVLPEWSSAEIVRSRDPAVLEKADIVVDVGGEYVPEKNRFDHHQRGFTETFSANYDIKLSSAGLIYKHFGRDVVAALLSMDVSDPRVEIVYQKVYEDFVLAFDGIDNGVPKYPADIKPKYRDATNASARVSRLNPWWNEPATNYQERFMKAVDMVGAEFAERVRYVGLSWLPARSIVETALDERTTIDASGKIVLFKQFCPWKEHLHTLENEKGIPDEQKPVYVIYEDDIGKSWRVQAVAVAPDSFESRKALPEPWRGVRDQALSDLTGIPGGVFVHASGFIGGNASKEGALEMAKKALVM